MSAVTQLPPAFCQYANGPCDQDFEGTAASAAILLYPAEPQEIAQAIEAAVVEMRKTAAPQKWRTWRDFQTAGQLIFCSICKSMRFADCVVADVTTLNFNLLFEIGFAVGLGLPIIRSVTLHSSATRAHSRNSESLTSSAMLTFKIPVGLRQIFSRDFRRQRFQLPLPSSIWKRQFTS